MRKLRLNDNIKKKDGSVNRNNHKRNKKYDSNQESNVIIDKKDKNKLNIKSNRGNTSSKISNSESKNTSNTRNKSTSNNKSTTITNNKNKNTKLNNNNKKITKPKKSN